MIATAYVQNGAKVYIASRKEKQLKEVSDRLNKIRPGSCEYVVADLISKAGCDTLVEAIKAKESKIHILVNNSGISWGAPYEKSVRKHAVCVHIRSLIRLSLASRKRKAGIASLL